VALIETLKNEIINDNNMDTLRDEAVNYSELLSTKCKQCFFNAIL
jgi:hypothetical protein